MPKEKFQKLLCAHNLKKKKIFWQALAANQSPGSKNGEIIESSTLDYAIVVTDTFVWIPVSMTWLNVLWTIVCPSLHRRKGKLFRWRACTGCQLTCFCVGIDQGVSLSVWGIVGYYSPQPFDPVFYHVCNIVYIQPISPSIFEKHGICLSLIISLSWYTLVYMLVPRCSLYRIECDSSQAFLPSAWRSHYFLLYLLIYVAINVVLRFSISLIRLTCGFLLIAWLEAKA